MAYNDKNMITDLSGDLPPQYFNNTQNRYEELRGADGVNFVGNHVMTEGGIWIPQRGSDDGAVHTQHTGSIVENILLYRENANDIKIDRFGRTNLRLQGSSGSTGSTDAIPDIKIDPYKRIVVRVRNNLNTYVRFSAAGAGCFLYLESGDNVVRDDNDYYEQPDDEIPAGSTWLKSVDCEEFSKFMLILSSVSHDDDGLDGSLEFAIWGVK